VNVKHNARSERPFFVSNPCRINTSGIFAGFCISLITHDFKPTRINTSGAKDLKSTGINTSGNKDLKSRRINTSKKQGRGEGWFPFPPNSQFFHRDKSLSSTPESRALASHTLICDNRRMAHPHGAEIQIAQATPGDVPVLLELIRGLAEYEKLSAEVSATAEGLHEALFGSRPVAEAILARVGGVAVGFAVFFHNFSTFVGRPGIYLEDLFVLPAHRGKGIGKALLLHVAALAQERGCGRFEWAVLDWNKPAIEFYRSLGARAMDEWTLYRLTGEPLAALAQKRNGKTERSA
jgi:GNAT superfamily N-acetyltransferase